MVERWAEAMADTVAMMVMASLQGVTVQVLQDFTLDMVDTVMDLGLVELCMGQLVMEAAAMVRLATMVVVLGMPAVRDMGAVVVVGMMGVKEDLKVAILLVMVVQKGMAVVAAVVVEVVVLGIMALLMEGFILIESDKSEVANMLWLLAGTV